MGSDEQRFIAIRAVGLFRELSDGDINALGAISRRSQLGAGELLIREGATGDSMFIVSEGRVVITKGSHHGPDETIVAIGPGHYVGLNALVESASRSANVVAGDAGAVVYELRFDDLEVVLAQDERLAAAFWRAAAKGLSRQLRRATTDAVVLRALIRAQQN